MNTKKLIKIIKKQLPAIFTKEAKQILEKTNYKYDSYSEVIDEINEEIKKSI